MKELQEQLQQLSKENSLTNLRLEVLKQDTDELSKRMDLFAYQRVGMPQKIFDLLSAEMNKSQARSDALYVLYEKLLTGAVKTEQAKTGQAA